VIDRIADDDLDALAAQDFGDGVGDFHCASPSVCGKRSADDTAASSGAGLRPQDGPIPDFARIGLRHVP
jgi:hypothetical protein